MYGARSMTHATVHTGGHVQYVGQSSNPGKGEGGLTPGLRHQLPMLGDPFPPRTQARAWGARFPGRRAGPASPSRQFGHNYALAGKEGLPLIHYSRSGHADHHIETVL